MQKVFVRGFGGDLRRLALLGVDENLAFVCGEEHYEDVERGLREPPLIGFHLSDVFMAGDLDVRTLSPDDPRAQQLKSLSE